MVDVIISEKPTAAKKIAEALSDGKVIKKTYNKSVFYYEIIRNNRKIIVIAAVGHLYNLEEREKGKGWTYPIFDVEWKESHLINKKNAFSKKYLDAIKSFSKEADNLYNMCDVDVEGELIFKNIARFVFHREDAKRAYFSTLTKQDLIKAFDDIKQHLDQRISESGETRHFLDFYWGINTSRALTLSIKHSGKGFKLLSTGRVQGPALKLIVDKELEIRKFKSEPYWQLELITDKLNAWHKKDKFWKREEVDYAFNKCLGKDAVVSKVSKTRSKQSPPHPFDLTSLQTEAYRALGISPRETLQIAQELYINGLISYPRTSSQKLPEQINYRKILSDLSKESSYSKFCNELLGKSKLKPNDGAKSDPAHPAIYPTGQIGKLKEKEKKVYDLIVHRFLATFAEIAIRETMHVEIDVNGEMFLAKGTITIEKGWHYFYGIYLMLKEQELPSLNEGEKLKVKDLKIYNKETQPPKRYTPASIIKELDKRNLGTKSTRAEILQTLYDRGYVAEKSLEATELGIKIIEILGKYSPKILDEELTKDFEEDMEEIREGKIHEEEVLVKARKVLTDILEDFKAKEKVIGTELAEANIETRNHASLVGKCPLCKEGNLRIIYSKKTKSKFVACDKYPNCKTTFSIPHNALVKSAKKECDACKYPMMTVIRKGRRPYEYCLNPDCLKKLEAIDENL